VNDSGGSPSACFKRKSRSNRLLSAVDEHEGAPIAPIGKSAEVTHHRRDADAPGDEHEALGPRMAIGTQRPEGPVQIGPLTPFEILNTPSEIAQLFDRELEVARCLFGAARE